MRPRRTSKQIMNHSSKPEIYGTLEAGYPKHLSRVVMLSSFLSRELNVQMLSIASSDATQISLILYLKFGYTIDVKRRILSCLKSGSSACLERRLKLAFLYSLSNRISGILCYLFKSRFKRRYKCFE